MKKAFLLILSIVSLVIIIFNCSILENTSLNEDESGDTITPTTVSTPEFSPSGGTYSNDQSITITTSTSGATIYYTTDGSDPDTGSTQYTIPIAVAGHGTNMTIKAIAVKTDMLDSTIASATYNINYGQCSTPAFSPSGGTYSSDQSIIITTSTSGATIYYTTDESDPDTGSTQYTVPISVAGHGTNMTIKAIAVKTDMDNSEIATSNYLIQYPVETPTFSPLGGTYTIAQNVIISTTTSGATLRFTTDGSTPSSTHGTIYSESVNISSTTTLKAIAYKTGMSDSTVLSDTYTITGTVATPIFSPSGGVYVSAHTVTISTTTTGATIKYTTDGSTPSSTNGIVYSSSILVSSTTTLKAFAYKTDWDDSLIASETYILCSTTTIDSTGDVGKYTSIATDSNDKLHISYIDVTNGYLKYITNTTGVWVDNTIDTVGDIMNENASTCIAIDSNNYIHISYVDISNHDLKYATNTTGSWSTGIIDSIGGKGSSIAVDSNNYIHISYAAGGDLKYTTNLSGSWICSVIDETAYVISQTSIKVDSNNKIHISYQDYTDNDLKYASNASGIWICSIIDSEGDVGACSSIAIDSNNNIHISYRDWLNSSLKYATDTSGLWVCSTIDSNGSVGIDTSIAVDTNNKVHISHFKHIGVELMYTTNSNDSWVTYTIDTNGWVGSYSSISIDSNDKIHISYYESNNINDLKYAHLY
ncbi:MAG: chitobiase/beta-hexosaminidase C-terminal domain-containing protein [Spirochaetes bacterium]|nr:chitobiase/beta-hexosaminidase C-terminal domain-containing protein [Spirochaetota bacterium]